ncbi:hypothetical protein K439DRAFT_1615038 [Ramaria rubella]|nr:hypothetical protein K439DRAFT_1615038 [Ramaria rubella]
MVVRHTYDGERGDVISNAVDDYFDTLTSEKQRDFVVSVVDRSSLCISDITSRRARRSKYDPPRFSELTWDDVRGKRNLPRQGLDSVAHTMTLPESDYFLPPSSRQELYKAGWKTAEVYREEECGRTTSLAGPFVYDILESEVGESVLSGRGTMEHEVHALGGTLFVVVRYGFSGTGSLDDTQAQLVAALFSASACNDKYIMAGRKVHGMITDLDLFQFFSYDPKSELFSFGGILETSLEKREAGIDMISVFEAYIEGLEIASEIAKRNADSTTASSNIIQSTSSQLWDEAVIKAVAARKQFQEANKNLNRDALKASSRSTLEMLNESVLCVTKLPSFTDEMPLQPKTDEELKQLAVSAVDDWCHKRLTKA